MSQERDPQVLLRQGIEETRDGNRAEARALFEQVVKLDPQNEKGWLWLASVLDDEKEQRRALERVLAINPDNERAQKALQRLKAAQGPEVTDEVIPGVSRRTLAFAIGGALIVIGLLAIIVLLSSINRNNEAAAQTQTQVALAAQTSAAEQGTAQAVDATATAAAQATSTPTPVTPTRTPFPTWTATATQVVTVIPTPLPMPQGLTGLLSGWSGRDMLSNGYLPVGVFDPATGAFRAVGSSLGRDVDIRPGTAELIYTRYDSTLSNTLIETVGLNSGQTQALNVGSGLGGILEARMPRYSADGNRVVFIATDPTVRTPQVYVIDVGGPSPGGPRRISFDSATYSFPDISPDGRQVVVVRNDLSGGNPGPDLVVLDVEAGTMRALTSDLGAFIETSPHWSPDGLQVVYAASSASEPDNSDIALRNADGSGLPIVVVRDPTDDRYPVFSPNGRSIAYQSNRGGQRDIYIYDQAMQAISQLTNTPEDDFVGGWWQPPG